MSVLKAGKKTVTCNHASKSQKTVVIIGGGPGGLITAESLRQVGFLSFILLEWLWGKD